MKGDATDHAPIDTAALEGLRGRFVVSVGTDLVDIDRMRAVIDRRPRFITRVFTEQEQAYCLSRNDSAERFAARFAAKEAVLKALGVGLGGADLVEIEVVRLDSGQPTLRLHGRAKALAEEAGIANWLITISHSDHVAHVFVAGLGDETADQHQRRP